MRPSTWLLVVSLGAVCGQANVQGQTTRDVPHPASPSSSSNLAAGVGVIAANINDGGLPDVTPGQIYTHTNVENGESTTATIKVDATKPDTEFDVTLNSGTFTRTIDAKVIKTVTPPVIVQTVTGAGVSFVQTDAWDTQKMHAYLPHALPSATPKPVVKTNTESTYFYPTATVTTSSTGSTCTKRPATEPCNGLASKECKMSRCMNSFIEPIQITTAWPATFTNPEGETVSGYITSPTYISGRPHWGTALSSAAIPGIYFPMEYITVTGALGCPMLLPAQMITQMAPPELLPWPTIPPHDFHMKDDWTTTECSYYTDYTVAPQPTSIQVPCWNNKSCHEFCQETINRAAEYNDKERRQHTLMKIVGLCAIGAVFIIPVFQCLRGILTDRKKERKGNSVMGSNTVDPVTGAVNPATGGDAVNASSTVLPATAAAGTVGRKAEEGRGPVPFAGGPTAAGAGAGVAGAVAGEEAAGGEKSGMTAGGQGDAKATGAAGEGKSAVVTSEKAVNHPAVDHRAEHVEHVAPVAVHDGADAHRTGSETVDHGSLRGRHINRK